MNAMNSKALAIHSRVEAPETWAQGWQVSGRPRRANTAERQNETLRRGFGRLQKFFLVVCALLMPHAAFARSDQASWENLSALGAGHRIQVLQLNSQKVSGRFVDFSTTGISLAARAGAQTISRQDVRSVTLMENHHRLRNTVIGLGVGAGVGAIVGAATYHPCSAAAQTGFGCLDPVGRGLSSGIGAVIGGVGGAIVGVLWPSHKTVYRSTER
jgi:hypothetical protein